MRQVMETRIPIETCQPHELPAWLTRQDLQRHLRVGKYTAFALMKLHGEKLGKVWRLHKSKIPSLMRSADSVGAK